MAGIRADIDLRVNTQGVKRSLDKAANEINKVVNKVSGKPISFNVNQKSFTQPLGRINASANEFTKSLEASNARVIAFGASVAILDGISNAFKGVVREAVKFEKTLADINVVLNLSNAQLRQFGEGLFDTARKTAQGFNIASEAALEFSRQGLSTEEVLRRTNDALILTRLTSLKATDAVAGLTAAVNAFGDAGLTTTDIIDKLSAVDVKFAVSSEDLINALQRAGAVAIDAGVEFDSLIGLVAALQQTTARGGAVIGNSLKTIFTRIQRPESLRQLEEMSVAIRDISGAVLPADRILLNISKTFDKLTQAQQSNIVQFSAGIFQANVFRAALRDLAKENSLQAKATQVSADAAGEAARKNEILNKTISALASQAGTNIQELGAILGDLALGPQLADALEFVNKRVEEIRGALGGGEDEGSTFAKGLVRGIGNVISGPGAIAFGAIFIKLFINIAKFASSSMKDVLGIVTQKQKIKQMEESIVNVLLQEKNIQQGLNALEGDRVAQEKFILGILERQANAMREQVSFAKQLAPVLIKSGVKPDLSTPSTSVDYDGDGIKDSFSLKSHKGLIPEGSKKAERQGAAKGGYTAGAIDSMNIAGLGNVVYNKAETVKQFPGMKQPAIMPPKQSKAGEKYSEKFQEKHGFDPYSSQGFVPNFASLIGHKLVMSKSRFKLFANASDLATSIKEKSMDIEEKIKNKVPVTINSSLNDIITSESTTKKKPTKKERLYKTFVSLASAGVRSIQREFDVRPLPKVRNFKKGKNENDAEFAERRSLNTLNSDQELNKKQGLEHSQYISTWSSETKKGKSNYPVDIIALGESFPSYEVKSGQLIAANLISKSLRMASDTELEEWMKSQGMITKGLGEKNLAGAQRLAEGLRIKGTGKDGEFTQEDAEKWGMNEGFVPNFKKLYRGTMGYPKSRTANVAGAYWDNPVNLYRDVMKMSMESRDEVAAKNPALSKNKMTYGVAEYNINDSLFDQLRTGVYKAQNVIKLKKFVDNFELDDIRYSDGIDEDAFGAVQEERARAIDSMKKQKGSKKIPGTASNPLPLIQELRKGVYTFPDLGRNSEYRDSLLKRDEGQIENLFNWKKTGERKLNPEFINNRDFFEDMSSHGGDKTLRGSMFGGKAGLKQAMGSSIGLIPNFGDIVKFERNKILAATPMHMEYFKSFQEGETQWRSGQSMKEFLVSLHNDYKDQFKSMQEWKDAIDGLQKGDVDVGMMTGSMSAHRAKNKNMSGGYVPNFASKLNYIELGKRILNYPGKLPIYEQLAEELSTVPGLESVTQGTISNLAGESWFTKGTRNAFVNYHTSNDKPGTFGHPYGKKEAEGILKQVGNKLRSTRAKGYAQKAGLDFEDNFRAHFTPPIPKPAGQPHMDFPEGTLDGLNPSQMSDIFLNTNTGGDAYKGIKGHPPEHFIAKYLRQKLDKGGKVFNFTSTLGSGLLNFALQEAPGIMNVNNKERYTDILGIDLEGVDRANQTVSTSQSLDSIFKHSLKLKEAIEARSSDGEIPEIGKKMINFNYEKDYVQSLSGGFVPNYANPLRDAIEREKAAGIPASNIRVEQSNQLKGPGNPMGLAVTNTRDEPAGVGQGIRRAKSMGLDPKSHGASGGFMPNFVNYGPGSPPPEPQPGSSPFDELNEATAERAESEKKATKITKQRGDADMMGLQKLFFLQSGISMANGMLQQLGEEGGSTVKKLSEFSMGITSVLSTMIAFREFSAMLSGPNGVGLRQLGGKESRAGGRAIKGGSTRALSSLFGGNFRMFGKSIGLVTKGLLRFTPVVGQIITGATALHEVLKAFDINVFDLLKDNTDRAADKLEKLSESAEKTQSALDEANNLSATRDKMSKLEILGSQRTLKQEKELISLKIKEIKQQTSLQSKITKVDTAHLKNKDLINEVNKVKSGEIKGTEALVRVLEKIAKQEAVQAAFVTAIKDFSKKTEDEFGMFESDAPSDLLKKQITQLANNIAEVTVGLAPERKQAIKESLAAGNIQGIAGLESLDLETAEKKQFFINALQRQIEVSEREFEDDKKIQQAKAGALNEYVKIVANYKKQREQIIHQNSLDNIISASKRKINSALIDLQSEYQMISRSTAIQNKTALEAAAITEKLESDKLKANNEALNGLETLRNEYMQVGKIASHFNSDAKDAQTGVAEFKKAITTGLNPQRIAEVGDVLGNQTLEQVKEINSFFKDLGEEIKDLNDNQEIVNKFVKKYGDIQDANLAQAILLLKDNMELVEITQKHKELLKKGNDVLKRSNETAETTAAVARAGLENEKALNLIKQKTIEGARKLAVFMSKQEDPAGAIIKNLQGEVDTLAVINHFRKDSLKKIMENGVLDQKAYETQVEKNRTDAEAALLSLKQLQVQENILRDTDEFKIIQVAKMQSEVLGASAAAKDAAFRNEYLSYNETRESLVQSQISEETTTLETTARNNLTKLKLLAGSEQLKKQLDLQIQEEITSAQSSALINSEKALILSAMGKQGLLLQKANELQESSNKLTELQNAIRKAAVSKEELALSVGTGLAIERAGAIRGTRESAMKATMTGSPEDALAFAQSLKETNKLLGEGSRAFDTLRVKIAEMDVAAKNLGSDLVDIGLDQTRSGMKQLFKDIGSGAKSAKEAWSDFGLGLADVLLDRMMEHNIDQIIKNLTFAFTGENALSEADKIAGSNNHLIDANKKLITSLDALARQVEGQRRALAEAVAGRADIGVTRDGPNPNEVPFARPDQQKGEKLAIQAKTDLAKARAKEIEEAKAAQLAEDAAKNPRRPNIYKSEEYSDQSLRQKSHVKPEGIVFKSRERPSADALTTQRINEAQAQAIQQEIARLEAIDADPNKSLTNETRQYLENLKSKFAEVNTNVQEFGYQYQQAVESSKQINADLYSLKTSISLSTRNGQINIPQFPSFGNQSNRPRQDFFGGKIQKFAKGGFVEGEPGVDKVPAMLTAGEFVVPKKAAKALKDGGILQHFEEGGVAQRVKAGATGFAQGLVMQEAARYVAKKMQDKDAHKDKPPEFDMNKFKNLNLDSTLSISRGDPRSSGKLLAKDPVMEEYRGHLLDVASYRAAQKNKKVSERMSRIGSIVGTVASFAVSQLTALAAKPLNALIEKGKNVALGHSGLGKHSEAFKAARKAGLDNVNYKDVAKSIESGNPLEYNGKMYSSDFASSEKGNEMSNFQFRARGGKKHGSWFESIKKTEANNPNYRGATAQDLQNKINSTQMEKVKMRPRSTKAITGIDKGKSLEVFSGGEIPAMLTAGESFIPAPIAKRIGYDNLNKMNRTGSLPIIQGPGGIDNVGPVGLNEGDFIIRRSSTDKLLRENPNMMRFAMQNPDGFRKAEQGYYQGGIVGTSSSPSSPVSAPQKTSGAKPAPAVENRISSLLEGTQANQKETVATNQNTEVTNNINVNVTIDKSGNEKVSTEGAQGTYEQEQQLAMKIKTKVLEVIREEKRIGGELSG